MTPGDVDRLPVGPMLRCRRDATLEEARRLGARWIEWDEPRATVARFLKVGEPMFVLDSNGERWTIGEWADGRKFKERWWGP